MKQDFLATNEIYHICTKSIAGYKIFNNDDEYERMIELIRYYQTDNNLKLSDFLRSKFVSSSGFNNALNIITKDVEKSVQLIAYCIMPTHIHLILRQLKVGGISNYIANILNGYTRYFNTKHGRKGPLWESRFSRVLVRTDEQLLHLTRYLHLNPVTSFLVGKPEEWEYSSYREYLDQDDVISFCDFSDLLDIVPKQYKKFVNDQISYQRGLSIIKKLLLET